MPALQWASWGGEDVRHLHTLQATRRNQLLPLVSCGAQEEGEATGTRQLESSFKVSPS